LSDTTDYLDSLPEPPESLMERWEAEPLVPTDDLTVEADEREEWRDNACD
jgi:hypothetical protein